MATLEQRLAKLEAVAMARRGKPEDPNLTAAHRFMDALEEALPDDEYEFEQLEFSRRLIYQPWKKSHMDKLRDLAGRIEAGDLSDEDRLLLDGLPQDAILGMTPAEFITTMISGLDKLY